MSLILGQVIPNQLVFSVLEIEKLNFSKVSNIGPSWSSCCLIGNDSKKNKENENDTKRCSQDATKLDQIFKIFFCGDTPNSSLEGTQLPVDIPLVLPGLNITSKNKTGKGAVACSFSENVFHLKSQ